MFMQLGFRDGLFDASVTVHRLFDADLVLISPRSASSVRMAGFPRRRLIQTLADPSVEGVTPVHWGLMLWRNPETRRNRAILALGFNPDDPFFLDPGLAEQTGVLKQKGRSSLTGCRVLNLARLPIGTTRGRLWKQRSLGTVFVWKGW
jgi:putative ABC transport system permease protein